MPRSASHHLLGLVRHFQRARAAGRHVFLLTSQWPDEGKSSLIVEIAAIMAEVNTRVLVVDGDRRRPTLSKHYDCSGPGLPEVLHGHAPFQPQERGPGLAVLGAGPNSGQPLSVPLSAVAGLGQELRAYDLTLIDSPPLSACSDALELAALCDAVVLVASARAYRGRPEAGSVHELQRLGIPVEGVILTRHNEPEAPGHLPSAWLARALVWAGLAP